MAVDPELIAETRAWFAKAFIDLRAADALTTTSPPLFDEAVFHFQQAGEKGLKGFLTANGCTFRKTHSLEEVGMQCLAIDPSLRIVIDQAVPLGEYAWKFRYPGGPSPVGLAEAADALTNARGVFEAAVSRIPFDARP